MFFSLGPCVCLRADGYVSAAAAEDKGFMVLWGALTPRCVKVYGQMYRADILVQMNLKHGVRTHF